MKDNFEEIYLKIIEEERKFNERHKIDKTNELNIFELRNLKPEFRYLKTNQILFEFVESPRFTPIPKEFFNYCCSKIRTKYISLTTFKYSEIYLKLNQYEYDYANEFKNNLIEFEKNGKVITEFDDVYDSAKLYVLVSDEDSNIDINSKTYKLFLKEINDENRALDLFQLAINDLTEKHYGDTISNLDLKNSIYKDVLIILHKRYLTNWKDTLEHELTHFVQRIVGLDKSLEKVYVREIDKDYLKRKNKNELNDLEKFIFNICNCDELKKYEYFLIEYFNNQFKQGREHHTICKGILNNFQRQYELDKNRYNNLKISQIEGRYDSKNKIKFRLNWLNNYLNSLNLEFFRNKLGEYFKETSDDNKRIKYRNLFLSLLYFGIRLKFPEYDIDNELIDHFKTFKFRNN